MANHDLTNVTAVINAGVANFTSKNAELMAKLTADQAELLAKIGKMQSMNIKAGLMPDDGDDIDKIIDEITEEVLINLDELGNTIGGFQAAAVSALEAAGFMRVDATVVAVAEEKEEEKKP